MNSFAVEKDFTPDMGLVLENRRNSGSVLSRNPC